jgi:hypothetical protein
MTALSSGLHFLTGLALQFGTVPAWKSFKTSERERKLARRRRASAGNYTPLTRRQKKELLDSIRHDDWHE